MRILTAFLALIFAACLAAPVGAEDVEASPKTIITQQIEAFLNGDAEAAYSYAAPGIKARFPDKGQFFAMVARSYGPVFSPGNFAFGRSRSVGGGAMIVQEVLISGRDGRSWKALYQILRQPDGTYRIGGVALAPDLMSKGI